MMTDAELAHLRALAGGHFGAPPKPIEISLHCDRCGAEFVSTTLCSECPHCNVIGVTA